MKHLGDITKINGAEIEPVNCITFGSPCTNLSFSGNRLGLTGEQSRLFMDAVRVIKEMREATNGQYPTFGVWENVRGAFSSNDGEDFRTVLAELASIKQPDVTIPRPDGKWGHAGLIKGNDWSIAWRLLDAQYWGVPQRRQRIALVVDFGGQRAGNILFECQGVCGDTAESIEPWQGVASTPENSTGTNGSQTTIIYGIGSYGSNAWKSGNPHSGVYEATTSRTLDAMTCAAPVCNQGGMAVCTQAYPISGMTATRNAPEKRTGFGIGDEGTPQFTLTANHSNAVACNPQDQWTVRKLTPIECERLQGFPDQWSDIGEWTDSNGKKHKPADTPRYKALGNSIALPQWWWLTCKMAKYLPKNATLGSLFDGIGGFPLVWETCYGHGTAKWASEIEEFCIAVTKERFGNE